MTSGQLSRLIADILAAEDEREVVDLLVRDATVVAELPLRERERANERIADAIRERRQQEDSD